MQIGSAFFHVLASDVKKISFLQTPALWHKPSSLLHHARQLETTLNILDVSSKRLAIRSDSIPSFLWIKISLKNVYSRIV